MRIIGTFKIDRLHINGLNETFNIYNDLIIDRHQYKVEYLPNLIKMLSFE